MFTFDANLLLPNLIGDKYVILEGAFKVSGGHLVNLNSDTVLDSSYDKIPISGVMMKRYELEQGMIFHHVGVLNGHYPFQPEESEHFALFVEDDVDLFYHMLDNYECLEDSGVHYYPNGTTPPRKRVKKFI